MEQNQTEREVELYVQFVSFSTAGRIPPELFQQSWIPIAKSFLIRGIQTIILSEKLNVPGEFNPYKFVSKHWWDSIKAVEKTFPDGLPGPATRGHITVSQGGIFKAISWTGDLQQHKTMASRTNDDFKVLFMLPTQSTIPEDSAIDSLKNYLTTVTGCLGLCTFKIDKSSGDLSCAWFYAWIIEVNFNSESTDPVILMEEIRNGEKFSREWKICILKDNMQLTPSDV